MKIIIIPDIHNDFITAEQIIKKESPAKVIFLGDYFDQFDDTPIIAYQVAQWLKKSLKNPDRIHLIGNHDISYMTNGNHSCPGWDGTKQMFINKVGINWKLLYHYCWAGDWLCTHAGLSWEFIKAYCPEAYPITDYMDECISGEKFNRLYDVSPYRGGRDAFSGILWCDYEEFIDIPNLKQIFGHTHGELRQTENHICLDTWLKYYAVYENGKMEAIKV